MTLIIDPQLHTRIVSALHEDIGSGDITSSACVPQDAVGHARVVAKADGIICGTTVFERVFNIVDPGVSLSWHKSDSDRVKPGEVCLTMKGRLSSILQAERTALNFLQSLSGTATLTSRFVEKIKHTRATILDTRKTTPLWRDLQKYAVLTGGGLNHRHGLYDMFLIKENHIAAAGGIASAIGRAMDYRSRVKLSAAIEVEVTNLDQLQEALGFKVDRVMLDNMKLADMRRAVEIVNGRCQVEASGGVTLDTVAAIAETGVDFISVGALTHSVTALDLSLLIE